MTCFISLCSPVTLLLMYLNRPDQLTSAVPLFSRPFVDLGRQFLALPPSRSFPPDIKLEGTTIISFVYKGLQGFFQKSAAAWFTEVPGCRLANVDKNKA
ncbi:hypothetical protein BDR07DRAFT_1079193 [Suillus spraguei]|nr:hypothetical protein BDR07DRAFT_1079193 [Suillus spraguei]